jgi:2-C-methyl-D-erythritol 4-phosphate cytidylyltransferase
MITSTPKLWAIVPAAGIGARFSDGHPKQFHQLRGKTMAEHTLLKLLSVKQIQRLICPCDLSSKYWSKVSASKDLRVEMVSGGKSRAQSVINGLRVLQNYAKADDWVLVHDIARPCITVSDINRLISELKNNIVGGLLVKRVDETLKMVGLENRVLKTPDREQYRVAQTPQMFRYKILLDALVLASSKNMSPTDEASAVEAMGKDVLMIEGRKDNIKITHQSDLMIAETILQNQEEDLCA